MSNAHLVDELAYVRGYSWSASTTSRLPAPIRSETRAMPTDDRIRIGDRQRIASLRKQSIEANKLEKLPSVVTIATFAALCLAVSHEWAYYGVIGSEYQSLYTTSDYITLLIWGAGA